MYMHELYALVYILICMDTALYTGIYILYKLDFENTLNKLNDGCEANLR